MHYFETKVNSELKYSGYIVNVYLDDAKLHDGTLVKREVVEHPGGVGIIPIDKNGNCYLVSQFRYPAMSELLEIPAGKLEKNEDPVKCAIRELSEETGFTCDNLISLGYYYTSPGFSTEKLYLYLATDLHDGNAHPDENEFLNLIKLPFSKVLDDISNGTIIDGKTVIAALKASSILNKNNY